MNSTASRIAAAAVAAAAIIGGTYAISAADEPAPNHCAQAIKHADRMAHLQDQIVGGLAALDIAHDLHMDAKAREIRRNLRHEQQTYADAQALYHASAAGCR